MLPLLRAFPDEQLRAMGTASFNLAKRYVSFLSSAGGQGRRHCASSEIHGARDIDSETLSSCLLTKASEMYWQRFDDVQCIYLFFVVCAFVVFSKKPLHYLRS